MEGGQDEANDQQRELRLTRMRYNESNDTAAETKGKTAHKSHDNRST